MNKTKQQCIRILVVDDEQAILNEFKEILCPGEDQSGSDTELQNLDVKLFGGENPNGTTMWLDLTLCNQGDKAVEAAKKALNENKPFGVVFLDVRMPPGPNGVWTAERIRELDQNTQIVIVTAYSDIDPVDIGQRVLPPDKLLYLQKPFHPHEIKQFASSLGNKWLAEIQLKRKAEELTKSNEQLRCEIEEHKKTEEKRQLLSQAIMSTEDSVYITDMHDKIIFVNNAFCQTYGYREDEITGKKADVLWQKSSPKSTIQSNDYEAFYGWEVGILHSRKDGRRFPVSLSRAEVKNERGETLAHVAVAHDISERLQTEKDLRGVNQQLKKLNCLKGKFTLTVSTQLSEWIETLNQSFIKIAEDMGNKSGAKLKQELATTRKDLNTMSRIINDLRELSTIETGQTKLNLKELNLSYMLEEAVNVLSIDAKQKNIELKVSLPETELLAQADRKRVTEVLINLIDYAVSVAPSNSKIQVTANDSDHEIAVKVKAQGPGIEEEQREKIFDRFSQVKRLLNSGPEQTCFALPLAKEFVEMHGGQIWIESQTDGQGNNFCFTLPKAKITEQVAHSVSNIN